jgi:hypothetical protein
MALGFVNEVMLSDYSSDGTAFNLQCNCIIIASGNTPLASNFNVAILTTDTPAQMLSKIVTGMVAFAAGKGITLARTDTLVQSFTRGS